MCLFLAGPADAARIVVLGDSLSDAYGMPREAGWVYQLDQRLGSDHEVIDGSISGDTSEGARQRVEDLLNQHEPQVLMVIIGGNDGLRGLPPGRLGENLDAIIRAGRQHGAEVALMQIRLPPNLGSRYVRLFEAVYPEVAEQHDVELLPFFLEDLYQQPGMLMDDGIHPTERAQDAIVEFMLPRVRQILDSGSVLREGG